MSAAWQAALLALALLSGVCAGAVIVLARRVTTIQRLRASGFAALSSDEAAVRIELKLASTHPTLVVFLTDTCAACQGIVPALNALSQTLEHGEVPLSAHALVAGDREGFIHRNALTMAASGRGGELPPTGRYGDSGERALRPIGHGDRARPSAQHRAARRFPRVSTRVSAAGPHA